MQYIKILIVLSHLLHPLGELELRDGGGRAVCVDQVRDERPVLLVALVLSEIKLTMYFGFKIGQFSCGC